MIFNILIKLVKLLSPVIYITKIYDYIIANLISRASFYIYAVIFSNVQADESFIVSVLGAYLSQIILIVSILIMQIMRIIGKYKIFKRVGIPKWKAFIPIYSDYLMCKIARIDTRYVLLDFHIIILYIASAYAYHGPAGLNGSDVYSPWIYIVLIAIVLGKIYYSYKLADGCTKAFKKDKSFIIGLMFFPLIYYIKLPQENNTTKKNKHYLDQYNNNINDIIKRQKQNELNIKRQENIKSKNTTNSTIETLEQPTVENLETKQEHPNKTQENISPQPQVIPLKEEKQKKENNSSDLMNLYK